MCNPARPEHYRYDRLIRCYMELFGAANVRVLPYEQLRMRTPGFVSAIVSFVAWRARRRSSRRFPTATM